MQVLISAFYSRPSCVLFFFLLLGSAMVPDARLQQGIWCNGAHLGCGAGIDEPLGQKLQLRLSQGGSSGLRRGTTAINFGPGR